MWGGVVTELLPVQVLQPILGSRVSNAFYQPATDGPKPLVGTLPLEVMVGVVQNDCRANTHHLRQVSPVQPIFMADLVSKNDSFQPVFRTQILQV